MLLCCSIVFSSMLTLAQIIFFLTPYDSQAKQSRWGSDFRQWPHFCKYYFSKRDSNQPVSYKKKKVAFSFFFSFYCILDMNNFEKMKGQGRKNVSFQHYQCVLLLWALSKMQRALSNLWVQLPWNLFSRYTFSSSLCTKHSKDYFVPEAVLHFNTLNKRLSTHPWS